MTKKSIAYFTPRHVTLSLGMLNLRPGNFIEDIFYTLKDATDFDDLTTRLKDVLADNFEVYKVTDKYIVYTINDNYLKFSIKENH